MAPRKRTRPRYDFGYKVSHLLSERETKGLEHENTWLAARVGVREGTVRAWIKLGTRPLSPTMHAVAVVLGVDPEWLSNDAKAWPPPESATAFSAVWKMIPTVEQRALEKILADPIERRRWIASWGAGQGGGS